MNTNPLDLDFATRPIRRTYHAPKVYAKPKNNGAWIPVTAVVVCVLVVLAFVVTSTKPEQKPAATTTPEARKSTAPVVVAKREAPAAASKEEQPAVSPLRPFAPDTPVAQQPVPTVAESVNLSNYQRLAAGMSKQDVVAILGDKFTTVLHKSLQSSESGSTGFVQFGSREAAELQAREREAANEPQEQEIDEWIRSDGKGSIKISFLDSRVHQIKREGDLTP